MLTQILDTVVIKTEIIWNALAPPIRGKAIVIFSQMVVVPKHVSLVFIETADEWESAMLESDIILLEP